MLMWMITKIGDILRRIIPEYFENIEVIYGEHYLHTGHDETNHMLLIRDCLQCCEEYKPDFDLDTLKVCDALEKELPLKVVFDKILTFEGGKTYKFYITRRGVKDDV